jgi:hypothetical protein
MIDAADLAAVVFRHPQNFDLAFTDYEALLFPRSELMATESAKNLEIAFDADSPKGFLAFFQGLPPTNA